MLLRFIILIPILLVMLSSDLSGQSISITSPTASQQVTSNLTLTVSTSSLPSLYAVEYEIDGRVFARTTDASHAARFFACGEHAGAKTIIARALDISGTLLATSTAVEFRNLCGSAEILTMTGIGSPVSGTASLTLNTNNPTGAYSGCWINGQWFLGWEGAPTTWLLDTTALANGPNEMFCNQRIYWVPRVAVTADAGSDTITHTAHPFITGDSFRIYGDPSTPSPLVSLSVEYFVRVTGASTYKVSTSAQNAVDNITVDLTSAGSGVAAAGPYQYATVTADDSTDSFTWADHPLVTGFQIAKIRAGSSLPGGIDGDTAYYVIRTGLNTFKLATSAGNAAAGTAVDLSSPGSGPFVLYYLYAHRNITRTIPSVAYGSTFTASNTAGALRWVGAEADVYLPVAGTRQLAPVTLTVSGTRTLLSTSAPTYTSSNTAVFTVSSTGLVTGVAKGQADLTVAYSGKSSITRVIVGRNGFPHLSRNGDVRTTYSAGESLWLRSLFVLTPSEHIKDPRLGTETALIGINAMSAALSGVSTTCGSYDDCMSAVGPGNAWYRYWPSLHVPILDANPHYKTTVWVGDALMAHPGLLTDVMSQSYRRDAIYQQIQDIIAEPRHGIIEMADEFNDTFALPPNQVLLDFVALINSGPTPISAGYPMLGGSPTVWNQTYCDTGASGTGCTYYTFYYQLSGSSRSGPTSIHARDNLMSMGQMSDDVQKASPNTIDRPYIFIGPLVTQNFTKNAACPGYVYVPGCDEISIAGNPENGIPASVWHAVQKGAAGVRGYSFAFGFFEANSPAPGASQEFGVHYLADTLRWTSMGAAFKLVEALEPFVLQPNVTVDNWGPDFDQGAKEGPRGRLLMVTNYSTAPRDATVSLGTYTYGNRDTCFVSGVDGVRAFHAAGSSITKTLREADTLVCVFPSQPAYEVSSPRTVKYSLPTGHSSAALLWSYHPRTIDYAYGQPCSAGSCEIEWSNSLPLYYRVVTQ